MIRGQRGSALLEVVVLGTALLMPLLWGLGVASEMHKGALASIVAAREAATLIAVGNDAGAERAVQGAFRAHGLEPQRVTAEVSDHGGNRSRRVTVMVAYPVPVMRAPFLGSVVGPSVWVRATHTQTSDPFRSIP